MLFSMILATNGIAKTWDFSSGAKPDKFSVWHEADVDVSETIDAEMVYPEGKGAIVLTVNAPSAKNHWSTLQCFFHSYEGVKKGQTYHTAVWLKASEPFTAQYQSVMGKPPFSSLGTTARKSVRVETEWKKIELVYTANVEFKPVRIVSLGLGKAPKGAVISIAKCTADQVDSEQTAAAPEQTAAEQVVSEQTAAEQVVPEQTTVAAAPLSNSLPDSVPLEQVVSAQELEAKTFSLLENYVADFGDPKTHVLYGGRLAKIDTWKYSPEQIKQRLPTPWGYGSRIEDTSLHVGHMLGALLDAYQAKPTPYIKTQIENMYSALKYIYESCPVPGIVPRGPHPNDRSAYYDDSSMDQNSTFIISLSLYANSRLASEEDKAFIKKALNEVGYRLEEHGWQIVRADGKTQCHVGFHWTQMNSTGIAILLPSVYALYKGTGNEHWLEEYEKFGTEQGSKRWEIMTPGSHTTINAHPIYANQNCFRLNAFYQQLDDGAHKKIIRDLMKKSVELQLNRDFPGDLLKGKYMKAEDIAQVAEKMNWGDADLHGVVLAKNLFDKQKIDSLKGKPRDIATLAHIRFPLGAFHMIMNSEDDKLIMQYVPVIWEMLNAVDLKSIDSAETNYLFSVVALQLYAYYYTMTSPASVLVQ